MHYLINRIRNIKISHKLYIGFGVILLLVIIASLLSVSRFKSIRQIYEKTNLIYNINIEVFQAKINRLKYFYSADEQSRQVMSDYIKHASALTDEAHQLSWSDEEKVYVDNIGQHLNEFQQSISNMAEATKKVVAYRENINTLNHQNIARNSDNRSVNESLDGNSENSLDTFIFLISGIKNRAYELQLKETDTALNELSESFGSAEKFYQNLIPALSMEDKAVADELWRYALNYKKLNEDYFTALNGLKKAEDAVKVAGDKSSAAIKSIINIVKGKNDALA